MKETPHVQHLRHALCDSQFCNSLLPVCLGFRHGLPSYLGRLSKPVYCESCFVVITNPYCGPLGLIIREQGGQDRPYWTVLCPMTWHDKDT